VAIVGIENNDISKVDKVGFKDLNEIFYYEDDNLKDYSHETVLEDINIEITKLLTKISISDVIEDSKNIIIKLNSNVTELSYDERFFDMDRYVKNLLEEPNSENHEYLKNIINNLNKDYFNIFNDKIDFLYIKFDDKYDNIKIKSFILCVLSELVYTFKDIQIK